MNIRSHLLRFAASAVLLAAWAFNSCAQQIAGLDSLLADYFNALRFEPAESKMQEVDYMIETVPDSAMKQAVALAVYTHFLESEVMGDEAVAIHLFDKWFDSGLVSMGDDITLMNARIFAEWNRPTLIGQMAPRFSAIATDGNEETLPLKGRTSILYFYDTSCSKCKLQSMLLRYFFAENERDCDFYAIYVGDNEAAWKEYIAENFDYSPAHATVHHLWDPEMESGMLKSYGVLQTPRMLLVSAHGEVIGRSLDVPALAQLMDYAAVIKELYDRCPEGSTLDPLPVTARTVTAKISRKLNKTDLVGSIASLKAKEVDLSQLKGSPAWVFMYSPTCKHCQEQMAGLLSELESYKKRHPFARCKAVFIDVDSVYAASEELGEALFDAFDLSILPYVISLDRRGRVTDRYLQF